jgi:hypothetical protein
MVKLRLGPLPDEKPVTRTIRLPAALDAELRAYAEIHAAQFGAVSIERLIAAMLERFIRTDRGFRAETKIIQAKPLP